VSLFFYLGGTITTPITDIGEGDIRLSMPPISETALALTPSMSGLTLDDPTGSLDVTALRAFAIEEADCSKRRLFSGYVADRSQARGDGSHRSLILGAARTWDTTLVDYNNTMWQRVIRGSDGNRPAETDVARINWIIGSAYTATVSDAGLISSSGPVNMDAADYRGRYPADVAADCGNASQKNYFVYFDEATWHPAFAYFDPTSTTYTSTLQFSNVLSDVDSSTTFAATGVLDLDPSAVYSGVYLRYSGGTVYRQNTTTLSDIGIRDASIDEPDIKTSAAAIARADAYLVAAGVEQKTLKIHTELPSTHVNLILPGQRVRVKFSHLTGYTSFAYARVVTRTVSQAEGSDKVYIVELECRTPTIIAWTTTSDAAHSFTAVSSTQYFDGTEFQPTLVDDDDTTPVDPHATVGGNFGFQIDLLAAQTVASIRVYVSNEFGNTGTWKVRGSDVEDFASYTTYEDAATLVFTHSPAYGAGTLTLGSTGSHRYWRVGFAIGNFSAIRTLSLLDADGTDLLRNLPSTTETAQGPHTGQPSGFETPTGSVNGSNTTFTTAFAFFPGTLKVWVNGVDWTENIASVTATTFTLTNAPKTNSDILVLYQGA
jgi:hypothetical protein